MIILLFVSIPLFFSDSSDEDRKTLAIRVAQETRDMYIYIYVAVRETE